MTAGEGRGEGGGGGRGMEVGGEGDYIPIATLSALDFFFLTILVQCN